MNFPIWVDLANTDSGVKLTSALDLTPKEGELPQTHHLALAALCVKIACSGLAVALLTVHFLRRTGEPGVAVWRSLAILGVTALTCPALLRWFS